MGVDSVGGVTRRRLLTWGGAAAAGVVGGVPLVGAGISPAEAAASGPSGAARIPPETRPGGAYDRYVAKRAAEGWFSGVLLLWHRGRTVLSRSYGRADQTRDCQPSGHRVQLSSAGKSFHAVVVLQLAQQGRLQLFDPVGKHLSGFAPDVAEQVSIHHLLSGTSGLDRPDEDVDRVFQSRHEVHEHHERRARLTTRVGVPGVPSSTHAEAEVLVPPSSSRP